MKTEWLSSPIPGLRTQREFDLNRKRALREKNSVIYKQDSGLIPKVYLTTFFIPNELVVA